MKPTQADYDKIADWIDASYGVVLSFKEGVFLEELEHDTPWECVVEDALRFWMKEGGR